MSPERWQQIERLFTAALDLPAGERRSFLADSCGSDRSLAGEIESLLAADGEAGRRSPGDGPATAAAGRADHLGPRPGEQIGPYRVVRVLGEGGMSTVLLAERRGRQYRHQVALKLLRRDLHRPDLLARFLSERQILAGLEHPNIARLYHGGTAGDGRPYFAMEYVEGVAIDRYCDERRLSVRQRIDLFQTVCAAVHHAHQNLVVHRDLKPSNILVTPDGSPKLLDFGIAKLLDEARFPRGLQTTELGLRPMTFRYASPEQLRGRPVTTASDVYSLGVLLYELLSGHLPHPAESEPWEIVRSVCEREPLPPGSVVCQRKPQPPGASSPVPPPEQVARARRTRPRELSRSLRGDLDNIVLKALAREPGQRYLSADQLGGDLDRHLQGLPVQARPPTLAYRAGKFLRRNRAAVAVASGVVLLLLAFTASSVVQTARTARERDRAERERDHAQQVAEVLRGVFADADPGEARSESLTASELLAQGTRRVRRDLADRPQLEATLLTTIGEVYTSLGLFAEAESALRESLAAATRAPPDETDLPQVEARAALGRLLTAKGEYPEAADLLFEALGGYRRELGERHPKVANGLADLAAVRVELGDYETGRGLLLQALGMQRELLGEDHPDVAATLGNLGAVDSRLGDHAAALDAYRRSYELDRSVFTAPHPRLALDLINLASAHHALGDLERAAELHRQALDQQRDLFGEEHPDVALTLNSLAAVTAQMGDLATAERLHREVLALRRRLLGPRHPDLAWSLNDLAELLRHQGDFAGAEPVFREALAIRRQIYGEEHQEVALTERGLAGVLLFKGDLEGAERLYRQAIATQRRILGDGHPHLAHSLLGLGSLLRERGQPRAAEPPLREAYQIWQQSLPAGHWFAAIAANALGGCLTDLGRLDEAEELVLTSLTTIEAAPAATSKNRQLALTRVIDLYRAWQRPAEAARFEERLWRERRESGESWPPGWPASPPG